MARSTREAETISLNEDLEMSIYVSEMWEELRGSEEIKVIGKTDSQTLERAIKAATGLRSRKLRIDIVKIKEMLETGEVEEIKWVPGK